ncbi:hypothetical protein CKO42_25475 [Lamprobacter modestohalophilus]|uniref:Uncharacterized protein n=1 Tax=Lamprobacter modestohalophilus TaxID=1064514 RepID=A0A9X0WDY6_9GAMM|nr:hypothetical protein [Lamprobacter modestohalophilus]
MRYSPWGCAESIGGNRLPTQAPPVVAEPERKGGRRREQSVVVQLALFANQAGENRFSRSDSDLARMGAAL